MLAEPERLLRRLAAGDERMLGAVMTPLSGLEAGDLVAEDTLDRQTRALVRLTALLALGAPTCSVQWAVELASGTGADVETVIGVLLASAPAVGTAGLVGSAPRLALALGFDLELPGWDGP